MFGTVRDSQKDRMTERQQRIFDFINSSSTSVLASVNPAGLPHAAVIYHVISSKDFGISFLTKKGTAKYHNIVNNNHVVLIIYSASTQTVAEVSGTAQEITDPDARAAIGTAILKICSASSDAGILPILKLDAGEYAAFTITPTQITMANFTRPDFGDYSKLFESIESFELRPGG